ncbi:unnamed protein product [Periconia digitata]|uniref:Zn(2)-C6 fungal-type domain-containing protein n=1 Tax=Periconia digitata TaxID=1303443 RepID=A0A9W4UDS4_9PLEO|nr:unnamed protein product [Periconia digitata]
MVGVAGKSKACNDCKRRRVKCGFERPGCLRCAKAHIQCSGYNQRTFFVNRTLADPAVSAPSVLAKDSRTRLEDSGGSSIQPELDALQSLSQLNADVHSSTHSPRYFRGQAYRLIEKIYLPRPEGTDNSPNNAIPTTWFGAICELEDYCPTLDHALIAFCTIQVHIAATNGDEASRDKCLEKYKFALDRLSDALNLGEERQLHCLLACIVVLSTAEFFCFPTDDSLRVHAQGIADILRLKQSFTDISSSIWTRLWSRLRVIAILSQLTGEQRLSVNGAQWADFMPENHSVDPIDQLFGIICDLPQLLRSAVDAFSGRQFESTDGMTIIAALWSVLRDIYAWQAVIYGALCPTPAYTFHPSNLRNPTDEVYGTKLFSSSIHFNSVQTALNFIMSWAFQLHILTVLHCITRKHSEERSIVPPQFIHLYSGFGSIKTEGVRIARLFCQTIEYCHRPRMGTFGIQIECYPCWVVRQFFTHCGAERELQWCQNVGGMSGAGTRFGVTVMEFQGSISI